MGYSIMEQQLQRMLKRFIKIFLFIHIKATRKWITATGFLSTIVISHFVLIVIILVLNGMRQAAWLKYHSRSCLFFYLKSILGFGNSFITQKLSWMLCICILLNLSSVVKEVVILPPPLLLSLPSPPTVIVVVVVVV